MFDVALEQLLTMLSRPLPGEAAHAVMAPVPRRAWPEGFNPARVRHAAGLLLLFPIDREAHVILTVRSDRLGRHGGQVSLPGGAAEPGETFEQSALREAHEEVALAREEVRVIGALTPLDIPVSGFRLHPIVAAMDTRPRLMADHAEVARILEVRVADLLHPSRRTVVTRSRDDRELRVPIFRVCEQEVWGATAMVLAEFLTLLGWAPIS